MTKKIPFMYIFLRNNIDYFIIISKVDKLIISL